MTVNEFKAWLEGYTENIKDAPSRKQWERIQEKLSEVNEIPNYYPYYPWIIYNQPYTNTGTWNNPIPLTTTF